MAEAVTDSIGNLAGRRRRLFGVSCRASAPWAAVVQSLGFWLLFSVRPGVLDRTIWSLVGGVGGISYHDNYSLILANLATLSFCVHVIVAMLLISRREISTLIDDLRTVPESERHIDSVMQMKGLWFNLGCSSALVLLGFLPFDQQSGDGGTGCIISAVFLLVLIPAWVSLMREQVVENRVRMLKPALIVSVLALQVAFTLAVLTR